MSTETTPPDVSMGELYRGMERLGMEWRSAITELRADLGRLVSREMHDEQLREISNRITKVERQNWWLLTAVVGAILTLVVALAVALVK